MTAITRSKVTKAKAQSRATSTLKEKAKAEKAVENATGSQSVEEGPVFFWRNNGEPNSFMSQWYESPFEFEGTRYRTAEEWMMVQKARLFGDEAVAQKMLSASTPKQHKALGRQVTPFDPDLWDKKKYAIVFQGTVLKFTLSENAAALRSRLLETGGRELVEASPMDRIWGIGFGANNAEKNRERWGRNLLGKALEECRATLREQLKGDGERE